MPPRLRLETKCNLLQLYAWMPARGQSRPQADLVSIFPRKEKAQCSYALSSWGPFSHSQNLPQPHPVLAHGTNAKLICKDVSALKGAGGEHFIREIVSKAKSAGKGASDYKWPNPATKEIQTKPFALNNKNLHSQAIFVPEELERLDSATSLPLSKPDACRKRNKTVHSAIGPFA